MITLHLVITDMLDWACLYTKPVLGIKLPHRKKYVQCRDHDVDMVMQCIENKHKKYYKIIYLLCIAGFFIDRG